MQTPYGTQIGDKPRSVSPPPPYSENSSYLRQDPGQLPARNNAYNTAINPYGDTGKPPVGSGASGQFPPQYNAPINPYNDSGKPSIGFGTGARSRSPVTNPDNLDQKFNRMQVNSNQYPQPIRPESTPYPSNSPYSSGMPYARPVSTGSNPGFGAYPSQGPHPPGTGTRPVVPYPSGPSPTSYPQNPTVPYNNDPRYPYSSPSPRFTNSQSYKNSSPYSSPGNVNYPTGGTYSPRAPSGYPPVRPYSPSSGYNNYSSRPNYPYSQPHGYPMNNYVTPGYPVVGHTNHYNPSEHCSTYRRSCSEDSCHDHC